MTTDLNDGEHIIEELKQSVKSIIEKTGSNKFKHELVDKINQLQLQLEELSQSDQIQFIHEMKDSFRAAIDKIDSKLMQHAQFEKVYNSSIFAAIVVSILFIFGRFLQSAGNYLHTYIHIHANTYIHTSIHTLILVLNNFLIVIIEIFFTQLKYTNTYIHTDMHTCI